MQFFTLTIEIKRYFYLIRAIWLIYCEKVNNWSLKLENKLQIYQKNNEKLSYDLAPQGYPLSAKLCPPKVKYCVSKQIKYL